jgi:hypothetical protein
MMLTEGSGAVLELAMIHSIREAANPPAAGWNPTMFRKA